MIKFARLALIMLMMVSYSSYSQTTATLDKTLTALQKQAVEAPFEKVHLHLDKPYYSAGDTIWFKGYTVIGPKHQLSALSAVLYVDLINGSNETIRNIKLPIASGLSMGDFVLPETLQAGGYRIRAYTNWMRNAGTQYFYDNRINIVNAIANKTPIKLVQLPTRAPVGAVDVQFFPESGALVNGIASKVA